jgi:transposase
MVIIANNPRGEHDSDCPCCNRLAKELAETKAKLNWFEEQHRLSLSRRFAPSSEKTDPNQFMLFDEAEAVSDITVPEPTVEEITYKRRKAKGKRDEQLKDLPEVVVFYDLPLEEQICPCCEGPLHDMDKEVRRELTIVPAQVFVTKHVRSVYTCRHCQAHEIETPIKTATMPNPAFPKSLASARSVAHIMNAKFVEGLPLYRQEQILERLGVELSRQTMANWMIKGAEYLKIIYDRLKIDLLKQDILHADETTLQVLHEEGRAPETDSYIWLYRSGREGPPIVLFEYQKTRAAEHPKLFLKDFEGYLHVDGYAAYDCLTWIILVACWAHARRKFTDALKALAQPMQKKSIASEGLAFCDKIFQIERGIKDLPSKERYEQRLLQSRPVLETFKAWLDAKSASTLPKGKTGEGITYCLNQWEKLNNFLLDGRLEIDNNRSERSIKPFVIGRKNWLFANTPKGAASSTIIYSIVETAKENNLNPYEYLTYLFEQMPNTNLNDPENVSDLLPTSTNLPATVRMLRKNQ